MKRVSVCMAAFNGGEYIHAQICSILMQLSDFDELIVSDDYSSDDTVSIVRGIADKRIKLVFNELSKGYSGNFENAIRHAIGDVIFLSDQDDVWVEGKVEKMLKSLEHCDFVVSDARFVDKDLNIKGETFFSLRGGGAGFFHNLYKSRYLGACMAFRRTVLVKLLPFPARRNLCPHDLWITLVAEFYFKVQVITEPLILYRRHGNNVSGGGSGSGNGVFAKILFRVYSFFTVLSRFYK